MNGLFRIATRTLCLGLVIAVSLAAAVIAKGVHPENLVAFRSPGDDTLMLAEDKPPEPPEHFAEANSNTRLDFPRNTSGAGQDTSRPYVLAKRSPVEDFTNKAEAAQSAEQTGQELPPLPDMRAPDSPDNESPGDEAGAATTEMAGPIFELPPPPPSTDDEPAAEATGETPGETAVDSNPTPDAETLEIAQATPNRRSNGTGTAANTPADSKATPSPTKAEQELAAQLAAMREQLDRMAALHEKAQQSQQSWLESHQLEYQRQLEQKLKGIETGLQQLQTQGHTGQRTASRSTVIRHDKTGVSRSPAATGVAAAVRGALESLGEDSNVNLTLSINVEGDVEMNLKDETGGLAAGATQDPRGYVIQKNGQKFQVPAPVPPTSPHQYQRDVFLPPIVK